MEALSLAPPIQRTPETVRWGMRCKAHNRRGSQCERWSVRGAYVCKHHGGAAPQTQRVAQRRLEAIAYLAIETLVRLMSSHDHRVQLDAAKMVLDYAGLRPSRRHYTGDGESFTEVDAFIEAITV